MRELRISAATLLFALTSNIAMANQLSLECSITEGASTSVLFGESHTSKIPHFERSVEIFDDNHARIYPKNMPDLAADSRYQYRARFSEAKIFLDGTWLDPDSGGSSNQFVIDRTTGRYDHIVHEKWKNGNSHDAWSKGVCVRPSVSRRF